MSYRNSWTRRFDFRAGYGTLSFPSSRRRTLPLGHLGPNMAHARTGRYSVSIRPADQPYRWALCGTVPSPRRASVCAGAAVALVSWSCCGERGKPGTPSGNSHVTRELPMSEMQPMPFRATERVNAPMERDRPRSEVPRGQDPTRGEEGATLSASPRRFARQIDCSPGSMSTSDRIRDRSR